jgi:hypothetical protein
MDSDARLSSHQVTEMAELVEAYFTSAGKGVTISGYDVTFEDGSHTGLANLGHTLAHIDRSEWPAAIAHHFESLEADPDHPATWAEAAPRVRLRLFPTGADLGAGPTTWPVTDDLIAALMLDHPGDAIAVPEAELLDWRVKSELAFDRALHNTVNDEPVRIDAHGEEGGPHYDSISGGPYTSIHVLVLERHLGSAPHGAIVSVPSAEVVLFRSIDDRSVVPATEAMRAATSQLHDAAAHPISPTLHWWQPTDLVALREADATAPFTAPDALAAILRELPEPEPVKHKRRGIFRRDHN